jgi:dimethylargininase
MLIAITRDVSRRLEACELSYVERAPIDVERAERQHRAYQAALASLGCRIVCLPPEHELPDAVFVEDVALVFDEIAIRTRPGAPSRRAEAESVANALASYRTVRSIEAPGTIDGGDVLRIGRTIYVGRSARSNAAAMEQLQAMVGPSTLGPRGYTVQPVPIQGCLHLKSAVTEVADGIVLINPDWVDRSAFAHLRQIEIDPNEPHAANGLRVGDGLIYPMSFPLTTQRLADAGIFVTPVDVSELQKAEGAVTCCSIVFSATGPA